MYIKIRLKIFLNKYDVLQNEKICRYSDTSYVQLFADSHNVTEYI